MTWNTAARRPTRLRGGRAGDRHLVDEGLVGCPVAGTDVDLERCLGCPALDYVEDANAREVVVCRPISSAATRVSDATILERAMW